MANGTFSEMDTTGQRGIINVKRKVKWMHRVYLNKYLEY